MLGQSSNERGVQKTLILAGIEKKTNRLIYILNAYDSHRTLMLEYRDYLKLRMRSVLVAKGIKYEKRRTVPKT